MRFRRLLAPPVLALACLGFTASAALAGEEDFLYDPTTVSVIRISVSEAELDKLKAEPFEYVEGESVELTKTDGTPAGVGATTVVNNVELKLKGKPGGSFQGLGGKAAFKLKFKKAEPLFGIRKLTLNNMTQDPSQIHEALAYTAFRGAGVPASRAGYAFVYLNGVNYGLHVNLESLDTISLPKIFGSPFDSLTQHLYEANEYGADFYPGKESMFEVDEGDDEDISDLTELIAAVDGSGVDPLSTDLGDRVDLAEMTRMWGVEKYIGHWDGYAGAGIPGEEGFNVHRPNNYYLYSDASGRFQMLPWGADQTWGPKQGSSEPVEFDEQDGRLFDLCLDDDSCSGQFVGQVESVREALIPLCLGGRAEAMAKMLAPWQAMEVAPRKPHNSSQIAAAVKATREFISSRPAEAVGFTGAKLGLIILEGCVSSDPLKDPIPTTVTPGAVTPPPPSTGNEFRSLGLVKTGHGFRLRLRVGAPGRVEIRGKARVDGEQRRVCTDRTRFDAPGDGVLVCRLSAAALEKLDRRALPIHLTAFFDPDSGKAGRFEGRVTLPRH
jgi:CotH kinase protein